MRTDLMTGLRYSITQNEITRRHQVLRQFMKKNDLGVLLILYPYEEGYRQWITGVDGTEKRSETWFVVPFEGDIYQIIGNRMLESEGTAEQPEGVLPDPEEAFDGVRTIYYFSAFDISEYLKQSGKKYIGVVHGNEIRAEMKDYLGKYRLTAQSIDVTEKLRIERAKKSDEEIHLLRNAVHLQDRVLDGLKGYLQPGMLEAEAVRYARYLANHLESGSIDNMQSAQIKLISWKGEQEAVPLMYPGRYFHSEDIICLTTRIIGDSGFYGTISRCMSFSEPAEAIKRAYDQLKDVTALAEKYLYPGITIKDIKEKLYSSFPDFPWEKNQNMIHGIGYCVVETPDEKYSADMQLQQNMVLALELKQQVEKGSTISLGNVYYINETGAECLNRTNKEWILI